MIVNAGATKWRLAFFALLGFEVLKSFVEYAQFTELVFNETYHYAYPFDRPVALYQNEAKQLVACAGDQVIQEVPPQSQTIPIPTLPPLSYDCNKEDRSGLVRSFEDNRQAPLVPPDFKPKHINRFIVIPEYKLLFCYVEKVGCAMFNNIFRLLRLYTGNLTLGEARFQAYEMWFRNTYVRHGLRKTDLEALMVDPEWTKAMFYRDPTSRFLSAMKSKCILGDGPERFRTCRKVFHRLNVNVTEAVQLMARGKWKPDHHFHPASRFCGGLPETLDYYDFIQPLEHETATAHVQTLLQHVGVPENIQAHLLPMVNKGGAFSPQDMEFVRQKYGAILQPNVLPSHATAGKKEVTFATRWELEFVQRFYSRDYETFNLPIDVCSLKKEDSANE